jgi:hypothetical protein
MICAPVSMTAKRMAARNKKPEDFVSMRFLDELEKSFYEDGPKAFGKEFGLGNTLSTVCATRPDFNIVTKLSRLTRIPSCGPNSQDPARNR